jgi:outer membrane protein assembly factor BamB
LAPTWRIDIGTGDSTPALVDGRLYAFTRQGGEEVTLCLDADTGDEIWRDAYEAQAVTGPAARHPGPRSSPTVADGKVVTLGVGGVLSCLDAQTGAVTWRNGEFAGSVPRFFTSLSPIVVDGMVVAHLGNSENGTVLALDLATGDEKWRWSDGGPAYDSPVLMTVDGVEQVVLLTENELVGLGAGDGALLWRVAAEPQRRTYNSATPIVDGDTVIYTGQGTGTRAVKIERDGDGFAARELWANRETGTGFSTPVLKDGLLFGVTAGGNLFCIDAGTGQTAWTDESRHSNFCSVLDAGEVILALPSDSTLIAFRPSADGYQEVASIKVADRETYAHPVVDGSRIYVRDQESLAMFTL